MIVNPTDAEWTATFIDRACKSRGGAGDVFSTDDYRKAVEAEFGMSPSDAAARRILSGIPNLYPLPDGKHWRRGTRPNQ
jgi:hypothetical protein